MSTLLFVHVICMTGFLVVVGVGIIVARYMKKQFPHNRKTQYTSKSWVSIHALMALASLFLATIGVTSAFFMIENNSDPIHFKNAHSIMGGILFILTTIVIPLFGTTSPLLSLDSNDKPLPIIYIILHRKIGQILWFVVLFNVGLGVRMLLNEYQRG
jgi:magnesium-transporting ATPase (P-type)